MLYRGYGRCLVMLCWYCYIVYMYRPDQMYIIARVTWKQSVHSRNANITVMYIINISQCCFLVSPSDSSWGSGFKSHSSASITLFLLLICNIWDFYKLFYCIFSAKLQSLCYKQTVFLGLCTWDFVLITHYMGRLCIHC